MLPPQSFWKKTKLQAAPSSSRSSARHIGSRQFDGECSGLLPDGSDRGKTARRMLSIVQKDIVHPPMIDEFCLVCLVVLLIFRMFYDFMMRQILREFPMKGAYIFQGLKNVMPFLGSKA